MKQRSYHITKKIGDIERLRGLAVLLTVIAHMPLFTQLFTSANLPSPLWVGVPLFFVISGYVITISTDKYKFNSLYFYIRRICRIFPILLISVFMTLIMSYFTQDIQFYGTSPEIIKTVSHILFFIYNFSLVFDNSIQAVLSLIGLWSISTEEQFYICFPLIYFIEHKKIKYFILISLFLGWGVALRLFTFLYLNSNDKTFSILKTLMSNNGFRYELILLGMLISYLNIRIHPAKSIFYTCIGFILIYPMLLSYSGYYTIWYFLFLSALGIIVTIAKADRDIVFTEIAIISTLLNYLGKRSYVIYVMHFQVIALIGYLLQKTGINYTNAALYNWSLMIGSIPFLGFIELIHRYIELPAIAWGKAYTSSKEK